MIDVGDIEIKCKSCGKIVGKLKDLFKFPHWKNFDNEKLDRILKAKSLSLLSHNHIDCFCENWKSAELQLQFLDDNDEFELVYRKEKNQIIN